MPRTPRTPRGRSPKRTPRGSSCYNREKAYCRGSKCIWQNGRCVNYSNRRKSGIFDELNTPVKKIRKFVYHTPK